MKRKKIHIALSYLNIYELNSFRKYLMSPFFNMNEALLTYFEILDKQIRKDKDLAMLQNEDVWTKLYPTVPYNDTRFRKLNSDISRHFENFLANLEFQKESALGNSLKLKAFKEKNITELYSGLLSHINSSKKSQTNKSADFYLDSFNIEKTIFKLQSEVERKSKSKDPVKGLNIDEISTNLDVFYIAEKLKYYCTLLSWSRSYKIDKKIAGIDFILKLAQIEMFKDFPPIKIYYTISKTISDQDNTDHYFKLKELISKYLHLFPKEESREIIDAALSYCVVQNNKGNKEFLNEVLTMYKTSLREGLIFDKDGYLSPTAFRNIGFYALRANDIEWAKQFIDDYGIYIPEEYRVNAINFSYARVEFYKKDYSQVIDFLNKVILNNFFYNVNARILMLLAYYELEELLSLDSLLQSFNAWVKREKAMSKDKKMEFLDLIKFTKRLSNTPAFQTEKLQKLLDEVKSTPAIVSKAWLVTKIEEKIGGKKSA